jgi:hypothetical protein
VLRGQTRAQGADAPDAETVVARRAIFAMCITRRKPQRCRAAVRNAEMLGGKLRRTIVIIAASAKASSEN